MARFPLVPTAPEPERAVLVGVEWRDNAWPLDRSLDELERLALTAGAQCVARLSQRLVKPYPKSFIGQFHRFVYSWKYRISKSQRP